MEFEKSIQLACERVYKKLLNDYGDADFDDVIFSTDDVIAACSVLLHYSSPEFRKQEINHLFLTAFGLDGE